MKTALLISIAAFTLACGGSSRTHPDASVSATGAGSPGANTSAAPAPELSSSVVTLVGCLQRPRLSGVAGTAGTAASDRTGALTAGSDARERQTHGAAQTGPFVLANAAVESGSAGATGGRGWGGPVASAGSSFELDGVPADAQASVNKLVRVTGRLLSSVAARPSANAGTAAAVSTTSETSARDDVRANSTGVAGDSTNNRLTVETVEVIAPQCGPQ
jgi:hypothetical protein